MDLIRRVTLKRAQEKNWLKKIDNFTPGDTVKAYVRIKEGEKERTQVFRGVVIKIQGTGVGKTFTLRKISSGVGVERTFPYSSPNLEKVEIVSRGQVRRSRLYFLRDLVGRAARLNSELVVAEGEGVGTASEALAAEAKAKAKAAAAAKSE